MSVPVRNKCKFLASVVLSLTTLSIASTEASAGLLDLPDQVTGGDSSSPLVKINNPAEALLSDLGVPAAAVTVETPAGTISAGKSGASVGLGQGQKNNPSPVRNPTRSQNPSPAQDSPSPDPSTAAESSPVSATPGSNATPVESGKGDTSSDKKGQGKEPSSKNRSESFAGSSEFQAFSATEPTAIQELLKTPDATAATKQSIVERIITYIPIEFRIAFIVLAVLAAAFALISLRERWRAKEARRDSLTDPLTGLTNRAGFEQRMELEWRRTKRYQRPLGLLLIDLDNFKEINDSRGHAAGDQVLKQAAAAIATRVRETDLPARLGGDEFVTLCRETSLPGLEKLADGLRDRVTELSIGMSVGFAAYEPEDEVPADLLARADANMYRDKEKKELRLPKIAA